MSLCIWYISKYVSLPRLGVGVRSFQLMSEFLRLGHIPIIITSDSNQLITAPTLFDNYSKHIFAGVPVYWIRTLKYTSAKSFRRILSWLDFELRLFFMPKKLLPKPDVLIVSSLSLLTILNGLLLRRIYGCKLIFEIRDIWPLTLTCEGGYSARNPFIVILSWIERIGYKKADVIVGTMPNLSEHVSNVSDCSCPVSCIPMGVNPDDSEFADPLPSDYISEYIPSGKFLVAHVGSIGIANSLDTFFAAAQSLVSNLDIHFLLVGDGDLKSQYIKDYGSLPTITFAPKVPKSMVQSVLKLCDLLYFSVHQSEVWRYGQSLNKVVDYMLSGKPIVASYTGFPSMINESRCGDFVPAGDVDQLSMIINRYSRYDKSLLDAIGSRGRSWILENRKYSRLAQMYLDLMI